MALNHWELLARGKAELERRISLQHRQLLEQADDLKEAIHICDMQIAKSFLADLSRKIRDLEQDMMVLGELRQQDAELLEILSKRKD